MSETREPTPEEIDALIDTFLAVDHRVMPRRWLRLGAQLSAVKERIAARIALGEQYCQAHPEDLAAKTLFRELLDRQTRLLELLEDDRVYTWADLQLAELIFDAETID